MRVPDVGATLNEGQKSISYYAINRSQTEALKTTILLASAHVVNGPYIKAETTFEHADLVGVSEAVITAERKELICTFEPHSIIVLVCKLR